MYSITAKHTTEPVSSASRKESRRAGKADLVGI
jgi:hypothetical protein